MDKQGLLLCAKYAASPNFFGYCGPRKSNNIIDHLKENIADKELNHLLSDFETLYPYLQLIARENKFTDPFNQKIVEAYWIGNNLLEQVKNSDFLFFLKEKLLLDKKINKEKLRRLKIKISRNFFLPHHTFHVFNIFKRTGKDTTDHTLETMDQCRIACGNVKCQNESIKSYYVEHRPLVISFNKLVLGKKTLKEVRNDYQGKSFLRGLKPGDWVSFHWGYICDKLTQEKVSNLQIYTQKAIDFFNI